MGAHCITQIETLITRRLMKKLQKNLQLHYQMNLKCLSKFDPAINTVPPKTRCGTLQLWVKKRPKTRFINQN